MKIVTVGGLIGVLELMREYQKETSEESRLTAEAWQEVVDEFITSWKKNGINDSVPLFGNKGDEK
jgi:hypothetical protein